MYIDDSVFAELISAVQSLINHDEEVQNRIHSWLGDVKERLESDRVSDKGVQVVQFRETAFRSI